MCDYYTFRKTCGNCAHFGTRLTGPALGFCKIATEDRERDRDEKACDDKWERKSAWTEKR